MIIDLFLFIYFFFHNLVSFANNSMIKEKLVGWLIGFYGISTFVGYLTPNPFLCK